MTADSLRFWFALHGVGLSVSECSAVELVVPWSSFALHGVGLSVTECSAVE